MAAEDSQMILDLHSDMIKKIAGLFSVNGVAWRRICNHVEMRGYLSDLDLGDVQSMAQLFMALKKKKQIDYGDYEKIRKILDAENVEATRIIDDYTERIKEALKKEVRENTDEAQAVFSQQKGGDKKRKPGPSGDREPKLDSYPREKNRRKDVIPSLILDEKLYCLTEENPVILKCAILSKSVVRKVQWRRKSKGEDCFRDVKIDNDNYFGGSVNSPSLSIEKTQQKDSGIYICQATYDAGTTQSAEIDVRVRKPNTGITLTLGLDTRSINVQFIVRKDIRPHQEFLREQIASILGVHTRIVNLEVIIGCIIVSFDINGPTTESQPSALALADQFSKGLKDGSVKLTDKNGQPLQVQQNSIKMELKATPATSAEVNLPIVSIDKALHFVETGMIAFLKCKLLPSTPITSVTWLRIDNEDETHVINIDNKKYFGGAVDSPSLTIDATTSEDEGRYVCQVGNSDGVGKSFPTFLCIVDRDTLERFLSRRRAEKSNRENQPEGRSETTSVNERRAQSSNVSEMKSFAFIRKEPVKEKQFYQSGREEKKGKRKQIPHAKPEVKVWKKGKFRDHIRENATQRTKSNRKITTCGQLGDSKTVETVKKAKSKQVENRKAKLQKKKNAVVDHNSDDDGGSNIDNYKEGDERSLPQSTTKRLQLQARMVVELSDCLCDSQKHAWAKFKVNLGIYFKAGVLANIHDFKDAFEMLRKSGHLQLGKYDVLNDIVRNIDADMSRIIEQFTDKIKHGKPAETEIQ